jgi:class 3 adenylate cyclase
VFIKGEFVRCDGHLCYEQTCATVPEQESARIVMLYNMLASRTGFESMYQCFKAPYMLPAQLVHAALVLLCTTGMFGVDALELYAVRARDEDVDLLIGVGLASIAVSALCTVVLTVLYWKHREQASSHVSLVSRRNSLLQEVAAVAVWIVFIVFLELVHAFGKGSTVPSWAYVIAGFLRAHSFHNLLTNGMALHPQPCGFLIGVGFLLVARTLSHLMYEERAAAGQLVTMVSAQCGPTEEWKPRNISQIVIILVLTTCAYLNRQLTERSAVRKLVATVHLKRRALEITSSLLPQHVIPKLEARVRRRSSAISAGSAPQPLFSLAEKHASVIILHADIVNFTSKCANATAYEVFDSISKLFNALDALCHEFELTKIETIGDAYLCSHSLTNIATPADARTMMLFASAMRDVVGNFEIAGETLQVRIGIHVGPMLGGIVGNRFPRYHLFGPHAKIAALLEQAGQPSCAVISDAFRRLLMVEDDGVSGDSRTSCEERLFTVSASTLATATASSGSVSASESGLAGSKTWRQYNSWRVQSWKALPCTAGSDGQHDVPDELGPVMLDWDHKGKPIRGMVLKRTPDVDESSFEGVDQHVIPYVTPCWMAFDIESCPTNVDRSVHDPREVNDQRGVHGSCDSRAGNSGFPRVPNGPGLLCAV